MPAASRLACLVLGFSLPLAAQRFVAIDQSPFSGHPLTRSDELFLGDLDLDGDPDLVHARGSVLRNDGRRRFVASAPGIDVPFLPHPIPTTPALAALVDLNGDGYPDLLSTGLLPNLITDLGVLLGRGNGSFQPRVSVATTGLMLGFPTAVRDVDGDGRPDVFVRGVGGSVLMRNLGGLAFADVSATHLPAVLRADSFVPLDFADVDRDGDLDMLTSRSIATRELWRNDGTGVFAADAANDLTPFGSFVEAAFFDQDQDLDPDLIVRDAAGALQLLVDTGGIYSASPVPLPVLGSVETFAVGDVVRDGRPDVAVLVANGASQAEVAVLENRGTSFLLRAPVPAARAPGSTRWRLRLADLDRDADLDVVVDMHCFLLGNGQGSFDPLVVDAAPLLRKGSTLVVGDLDGDGDPDLAAGAHMLLQNGDGRFAMKSFALPGDGVARALVDFDLDGDLDLVHTAADDTTGSPFLSGMFANQGGTFAPVPFPASVIRGEVVARDLDADGLPDLVASNGVVLRNLAGVTFAPAASLPVAVPSPVAVGDLDSDGRPDVLIGVEIWRNTGGMNFVFSGRLPGVQTTEVCRDLEIVDLDLDGDDDVVVRVDSIPTYTATFLQNAGGLALGSAVWSPVNTEQKKFAVADFDADGLVDVVDGVLWKNLGAGVLQELQPLALGPDDVYIEAIAAADFDRDGDVDVAVSSFDHVRILASRRRQVWSPRPPTLGDLYAVEFAVGGGWGGGPGVALPLLGLQRIPPVFLPAFGLLHLDAATAFQSPVLAIGAVGSTSISFVVPNDPVLGGLDVHWQVLGQQGTQLQLSNVWTEHIAR